MTGWPESLRVVGNPEPWTPEQEEQYGDMPRWRVRPLYGPCRGHIVVAPDEDSAFERVRNELPEWYAGYLPQVIVALPLMSRNEQNKLNCGRSA